MRAGRVVFLCAVVLLCASGHVRAGDEPAIGSGDVLVAGNEGWLWIVRNTPGSEKRESAFAVAGRPAGKEWDVTARNIKAQAAAAAAIGDRLHVICRRGAYLTFRQGDRDFGAQRSLEFGPLAVAAAPGFGPEGKTVLLAVADARVVPSAARRFADARAAGSARSRPASAVALSPTTQAVSKPISPKSIIALLVLVYSGDTSSEHPWEPIALLESVEVAPEGRVMTAVVAQTLYVLVGNAPAGANRLMAWTDGQWREVPLTGPAAGARAVGMCVVGGRLVLALARPGKGDKTWSTISLAALGADDEGKCEYYVVKGEGAQAERTWSAGSLPAAAGFAEQLALIWQDGETIKLATCSSTGSIDKPKDITVFADAESDGQAEKLYFTVMWALMASIFATAFIRRSPRSLEPFQLPGGARPAQMPRRIMAAVLDMLPFSLLATVIFVPHPPTTLAELREFIGRRDVPDNLIYSQLLWIAMYTTYATAMEMRFGTTLGKSLLKLRVVGHAGAKPTPREILLRNIVRAVPLCWSDVWVLPLLLIVFPLINRNRQRMGDMLARTAVIDTRPAPPAPAAPPSEDGEKTDSRISTYTEHMPPDDDEEHAEGSEDSENSAPS